MYQHVISLGHFCSVAQELERLHLRSFSGPFDWIISDFSGVMALIDDGFADFLTPAYLCPHQTLPHIIRNQKYGISFYHDFTSGPPISEQLPMIKDKYERRIVRFYKAIKEATLFVRYIQNEEEWQFIRIDYVAILKQRRKWNKENDLLLIANSDLPIEAPNELLLYTVEKDENDVVARKFLDKNKRLFDYLQGAIISEAARKRNLLWYEQKVKH